MDGTAASVFCWHFIVLVATETHLFLKPLQFTINRFSIFFFNRLDKIYYRFNLQHFLQYGSLYHTNGICKVVPTRMV